MMNLLPGVQRLWHACDVADERVPPRKRKRPRLKGAPRCGPPLLTTGPVQPAYSPLALGVSRIDDRSGKSFASSG
jgi:hypothetical protein